MTNVSTPQADTECPSAKIQYSILRYKKQEKLAPYIPMPKDRGFTALLVSQAIIGFGFFGAAAISLGIAHAALDASIKHAKEKVIVGSPIGTNQLIQSLITEMSLGVDTARALLYSAASKIDTNSPSPIVDALKVKLYASEAAIDVTNKAVQIYGGHGYCKEFPLERYYRDARGLTLHFKTTELLKTDIGKILIGA